jgi:hypothetical protein
MICTILNHIIGDTKIYNLTFKDSDDVAIDITWSTVYLTVKKSKDDTDLNAIFQKVVTSHTDPVNWQTTIEVVPSDTKSENEWEYFFDIQLTTSTAKIYTVLKGQYNLTYEITAA